MRRMKSAFDLRQYFRQRREPFFQLPDGFGIRAAAADDVRRDRQSANCNFSGDGEAADREINCDGCAAHCDTAAGFEVDCDWIIAIALINGSGPPA